MIFQQFNLVGRLDVLTNVLMGRLAHTPSWRSLSKLWTHADRLIAMAALHQFDMASIAAQRADSLSGSHEKAVLALVQGTVDVCANWWNAEDDSNLTRMITKGMVKNPDGSPAKVSDFRVILKSDLIINSPTAMLSDLPPDLKAAIMRAFMNAATADKARSTSSPTARTFPGRPSPTRTTTTPSS